MDQKDALGMSRKLSQAELKQIFICENMVGISFDPPDKKGKYLVSVILKDNVSGKQKTIEKTIENIQYKYEEVYKENDKKLDDWFSKYYQDPKPDEVINVIINYSKKGIFENKAVAAISYFFATILDNNPFLTEELLNVYAKQETKTKTDFLKVFAYMKNPPKEIIIKLGQEENNSYTEALKQKAQMPDLYGKINSGEQLDMLWSDFFATGQYKPLKKIAEALDYYSYVEKGSKFNKDTNPAKTEDDKATLYYYSIFRAAMWSIGSNCKQHMLIRGYYNGMLQDTEVSKIAKACISATLKNLSKSENNEKTNNKPEPSTK
jgi:hypothetical protein